MIDINIKMMIMMMLIFKMVPMIALVLISIDVADDVLIMLS